MPATPSFDDFQALARTATLVPVWREFPFDTETAVSAYHKLARPPFGFLLESVVGGETWARYTMLGTEPRAAWRMRGRAVSRWTPGAGWGAEQHSADPLGDFDRLLHSYRPAELPGLPRFWGGAVGYFGYDAVRLIERLPDGPREGLGLPDALFMLTGTVLVVDNLFNRARAIVAVETGGVSGSGLEERYTSACRELDALVERLRSAPGLAPLDLWEGAEADPDFASTTTRGEFEDGVRRVQEYIRAGDAFQVVLSQRLTVPLRSEPFTLYRALRTLNPSPYLFHLDLDGFHLIGSSPEVMVRLEEGRVTVRPIAGTRRRGGDDEEDRRLAESLLADP
ncbi:MAG TPA: chorismate-binding protein, partial [Longimicrobium sp.]|nr:chorismate-binding protein [Longimicrobium sp.]